MTAKKNIGPGPEEVTSAVAGPGPEEVTSAMAGPGPEEAASAVAELVPVAELVLLEKLIEMVQNLNHHGHRQGLLSDLIDHYGAEVVVVGPEQDNALIRLAGIEGGYSTSMEIRLENWLQNARQKLALARDAAAGPAETGV